MDLFGRKLEASDDIATSSSAPCPSLAPSIQDPNSKDDSNSTMLWTSLPDCTGTPNVHNAVVDDNGWVWGGIDDVRMYLGWNVAFTTAASNAALHMGGQTSRFLPGNHGSSHCSANHPVYSRISR